MELLMLNKKVRNLWIVRNTIIVILLVASYVVGGIFLPGEYTVAYFVGVGIPLAIIVVLLMLWPFLKYKLYSYSFDEKRIRINYGVIFRHRELIPVRQIQDLHIYNGPIMSMLNLSGVTISTAGSDFSIAGLLKEDAQKIVDELEVLLSNRLDGDSNEEI